MRGSLVNDGQQAASELIKRGPCVWASGRGAFGSYSLELFWHDFFHGISRFNYISFVPFDLSIETSLALLLSGIYIYIHPFGSNMEVEYNK